MKSAEQQIVDKFVVTLNKLDKLKMSSLTCDGRMIYYKAILEWKNHLLNRQKIGAAQLEEENIEFINMCITNSMEDIQEMIKDKNPAILMTFEQMEADLKKS